MTFFHSLFFWFHSHSIQNRKSSIRITCCAWYQDFETEIDFVVVLPHVPLSQRSIVCLGCVFFACFVSLLSYLFYRQCDIFFPAFPLSSCLEKFVISLRFFNGFIFIIISPGTHFFCSIQVCFFLCRGGCVCVMRLLRYFKVAILLHRTKLRFHMSISWNR